MNFKKKVFSRCYTKMTVVRSGVQLTCLFMFLLVISAKLNAGSQFIGRIFPSFQASQSQWADYEGIFLVSERAVYGLGFQRSEYEPDVPSFILAVIHLGTSLLVWTANNNLPVNPSDNFLFDPDGNVYLARADGVVWSTKTTGQNATALVLRDSGNLVLIGDNNDTNLLWQSFSNPAYTLLSGQVFEEGMRLRSNPNDNNLSHSLAYVAGDLVLSARYDMPQPYWSLSSDSRRKTSTDPGSKSTTSTMWKQVHSASIVGNSWNFYDKDGALVWQLVPLDYQYNNSDANNDMMWAAVLGRDGAISFYNLNKHQGLATATPERFKIPESSCSTPEPCQPYFICSSDNKCECPSILKDHSNCKLPDQETAKTRCGSSAGSIAQLVRVVEDVDYFAIGYVDPYSKSKMELDSCKEVCLSNCSCHGLVFDYVAGGCFVFDQMGSFKLSNNSSSRNSTTYDAFVKVPNTNNDHGDGTPIVPQAGKEGIISWLNKRPYMYAVILVLFLVVVVVVIIIFFSPANYNCLWSSRRKRTIIGDESLRYLHRTLDFDYATLCDATNNFSDDNKIGEGGSGSVYKGELNDGTLVAVKKLKGIGLQGEREFRAEVDTISEVHHVNVVKLKGYCVLNQAQAQAQGNPTSGTVNYYYLVYEFMENGSLDKWLFHRRLPVYHGLNWNKRMNIAVGIAKGLAFIHTECDKKIVHRDIKPQNILLDANLNAKIADFGLAKRMDPLQSLTFTGNMRGTFGYVPPRDHAISDKTDVYRYGILLLEIIGGRKNYDKDQGGKKVYFHSYARSMLKEGKVMEILDPCLSMSDPMEAQVSKAVAVALLCIDDDMESRISMTRVVQMLEDRTGHDVPCPTRESSPVYSFHSADSSLSN